MALVNRVIESNVLVLKFSRGAANAINGDLLHELKAAVHAAASDSAIRGLVLASDSASFFSGGFDVGEVFNYDRETMAAFFGTFIDTYECLFRLSKPVVAAIGGHAYAGGAILALTADLRIFGEGSYGFALNEVNIGLALPPGIISMAIAAVGYRNAHEMLLSGRSLNPGEAMASGLANQVVPAGEVVDKAIRAARSLAGKSAGAFQAIKSCLRDKAYGAGVSDRDQLPRFMDSWFGAEAVDGRAAVMARMGVGAEQPAS